MLNISEVRELAHKAKLAAEEKEKEEKRLETLRLENEKLENERKFEAELNTSCCFIEKEIMLVANKGERVYKYGMGENPKELKKSRLTSHFTEQGFEVKFSQEKRRYVRNYEADDVIEYLETIMEIWW